MEESKSGAGAGPEHETESAEPEPIFNPDLTRQETVRGEHVGDQYVRVEQPYGHLFRRVSPGYLRATREVLEPHTPLPRFLAAIKRLVIGTPLATEREIHERLTKVKALAVFASDAISSTAYATQEILLALVFAGSAALGYAVPISLLIATLLLIVAFSYRQTVFAYPSGGGSYIVARENISETSGLIAASALMLDYVLTVAVSISSGVDALVSAFPQLRPYHLFFDLGFVAFITLANLRGIRESGSIFAIPTYAFIFGLAAVVAAGFARLVLNLGPAEVVAAAPIPASEPVSIWLLLTAFSAGSVAMSGTEAISNGVPAFKPPESKNAATTLTVMASLLGGFFLSISILAAHFQIVPGQETVISQLVRASTGTNFFYYFMQFATMGILVIAANTSFADFPRLSSILARDDFMPHRFQDRGDRLAFSTGIVALGGIAALLIAIFQGDTHLLIPLYAVGVFLAFTMSQAGMVIHWRRTQEPGWQRHSLVNGIGAFLTALVLVIAAVTKFIHGAWIILVAIPIIVVTFKSIHRHYMHVDRALELEPEDKNLPPFKLIVLVVIPSVNYAAQRALTFARSISSDVTAVHVSFDRAKAAKLSARLKEFSPGIQLVVLEDPYRNFYSPLESYVQAVHEREPEAFITIVLPEFIVRHWWETLLHNRATHRLEQAFRRQPNIAIVNVPYLIDG